MKLATLVRIAKEIERERGITIRATMTEMWKMLEDAAGHCKTKAAAKTAIERDIYNITEK